MSGDENHAIKFFRGCNSFPKGCSYFKLIPKGNIIINIFKELNKKFEMCIAII